MTREVAATEVLLSRRLEESRAYFDTGETRSVSFRKEALRRLREEIVLREDQILSALEADLGKPAFEAWGSEIGMVLEEISYIRRRLSRWAKPKRVPTPVAHFPSRSSVHPEPIGVALILAPWNYPFQLALAPLVGAIAAGCTAILKPSEHAPATGALLRELIAATFPPEYIDVVEGEAAVAHELVSMPFDKIFFTGSTAIGKKVAAAAAAHLTPVTLELGGKSPTIVHRDADLPVAARRIAWGKFLNAGQTCVAPDYIYVHQDVAEQFLDELKGAIRRFFGEDPADSPDYARIIHDRHFDRLSTLLDEATKEPGTEVRVGGGRLEEQRYIAPTVVTVSGWESPLMDEEIFGPILPILRYSSVDQVIREIRSRPKPLALYLFTRDGGVERRVITEVQFGGGSVNETILHLVNPALPFGGVGQSGTGSYHGKASFDTFTHYKSILRHANRPDIPIKYPPYTKKRLALIRRLLG